MIELAADERSSLVTMAVIARNEAAGIGATIASIGSQSLLRSGRALHLIIYANGCTDDTADVARRAATEHVEGKGVVVTVVDDPVGGKSRSWNAVVHEVAAQETDFFVFLDADITLATSGVLHDLVVALEADQRAWVCSGRPTKVIALKRRKTLLDRFSLLVSEQSRAPRSVNGSLYAMRGEAARDMAAERHAGRGRIPERNDLDERLFRPEKRSASGNCSTRNESLLSAGSVERVACTRNSHYRRNDY